MKIYTKILATTLPLVFLALIAAVGTTYYFSRTALTDLAETWLATRALEAKQIVADQEQILHEYGLEAVAASVAKAKLDAGTMMMQIEVGKEGFIFVIEAHGVIAIHPDNTMVGRDVSGEPWFKEMKPGKGRFTYMLKGGKSLAIYDYFAPWEWFVLATDPEREVYGVADRLKPFLVSIGILVALAMAVALMILARNLTAPLRSLTAGADRIGRGDLKTPIAVRSQDEFGQLAEAFNQMSARLHKTLATLQHKEEHFRSIIENSSDIIIILDADGNFRFVSPSMQRVLGYAPEHMLGRQAFEYIHQDDTSRITKRFFRRVKSMIRTSPTEFRFRHKSGSWRTLEGVSKNLLDNAAVNGLVVNIRDISGRKRVEEALHKSYQNLEQRVAERTHALVKTNESLEQEIQDRKKAEAAVSRERDFISKVLYWIDSLVVVIDLEGFVVSFNRASELLTGYRFQEVQGRPFYEILIPPGERDGVKAVIEEVSRTAPSNNFQNHWVTKDGQKRLISWVNSVLTKADGSIEFILCTGLDITEQKRLENQLQQAQKMKALGTLAGGIAHDFNNLLMGIQGRASLMAMDLETSHPHLTHVRAIEDYIRSASDLTKQLLGFALGGKYEVKPVDVNELVATSAAMFGRTRKEIRIRIKSMSPAPVAEADRPQLEQVLLNLYVNAAQAMPAGGDLYLETASMQLEDAASGPYQIDPGRYARISVTDTGIGMTQDIQQRIFDPFFSTKEKGRGTGLGLASAYGIIQNHGGKITVYSEPGHGTTFNIYLPVSDKTAGPEVAPDEQILRGTETILVVDDEPMIVDVAKAMISKLGYTVITAADGEQAIETIATKGGAIDLVILDMIMPGLDGGKTFDRIRKLQPDLPVMLSSGYSLNGQATEIMRRGCNGFIQKPFNIAGLSKKIRYILDAVKATTEN